MTKALETHTFQWSRNYGDCSDCGLPAAYRAIDAYGAGRDQSLCSMCAAESAASGQSIARLDDDDLEGWYVDESGIQRDTDGNMTAEGRATFARLMLALGVAR